MLRRRAAVIGHERMIPIARTSQVAGRFLFLLVTCAMWVVDVMACSVFFAFGDMMDSGW